MFQGVANSTSTMIDLEHSGASLDEFHHLYSLHTNAFDEAITTPTEDSVRRAMAIQLIINRE